MKEDTMTTSQTTTAPFTFNKDYDDHAQFAPFQEAYTARADELAATGQRSYNDSFKGHLGGEFATARDEDAAIYVLGHMRRIAADNARIAAYLADGGHVLTVLDAPTKYRSVVVLTKYSGGTTGWAEYKDARVLPKDGKPWIVLPKGKRTNGYRASDGVMVKA